MNEHEFFLVLSYLFEFLVDDHILNNLGFHLPVERLFDLFARE